MCLSLYGRKINDLDSGGKKSMLNKNLLSKVVLITLLLVANITACFAGVNKDKAQLDSGAGMFSMAEPTGANQNDLNVFYYRPEGWTVDKPIVIVQHGVQRNAEEYRDGWIQYADKYNLLVVCPEFSKEKYPGVRYYNIGNITDSGNQNGTIQPKDEWVFSVVDRVFSEVRDRTGSTRSTFTLFGHSAGAQMVHRYVLFAEESHAGRIISANAGWYTMPDDTVEFPYGLEDIAITEAGLAKAFAKPVIILLGENDTNFKSKVLRHTPEAEAQGINRFERGKNFFETAQAKAAELNVPFNWKLITVPGVGHDDLGMAAAAAELIAKDNL